MDLEKCCLLVVFFFVQCFFVVVLPSGVTKASIVVPTIKSQTNSSSLEKSNRIDEKEIFENGDDKANNLSERSFIWINRRFKSPLRNKIYNSKREEWKLGNLYPFKKPQYNGIPLALPQRQYVHPPKHSITHKTRLPPKLSSTMPQLFRPKQELRIPCTMSDKHLNRKTSTKCNKDFPKPFIYEKLRQDLPKMVPHLKTVYDAIPGSKPKSFDHQDVPKKPHNSITSTKLKETYGFPSLYQLHRSAFSTNELSYKPEEINLEGNLFSDSNFFFSPVDGSDEEKLLERYIKHTLADNGVRVYDDELHTKCTECNNEKSNTNCKCETDAPEINGKIYQLIEKNQFTSETETDSKNKVNEYDDSSNDETLSNKTMVDILFTPNTKND